MQYKFSQDEKELITIVIQDALSGASKAKDKANVKYGKRLLNKFAINTEVSHVKQKDLSTLIGLIASSIDVLEGIKSKQTNQTDTDKLDKQIQTAYKLKLKLLA